MTDQNAPQTITATEMQTKSGQIIKRCYVGREHFIVKWDGFPVVAIIPVDEYQHLMARRDTAKPA